MKLKARKNSIIAEVVKMRSLVSKNGFAHLSVAVLEGKQKKLETQLGGGYVCYVGDHYATVARTLMAAKACNLWLENRAAVTLHDFYLSYWKILINNDEVAHVNAQILFEGTDIEKKAYQVMAFGGARRYNELYNFAYYKAPGTVALQKWPYLTGFHWSGYEDCAIAGYPVAGIAVFARWAALHAFNTMKPGDYLPTVAEPRGGLYTAKVSNANSWDKAREFKLERFEILLDAIKPKALPIALVVSASE